MLFLALSCVGEIHVGDSRLFTGEYTSFNILFLVSILVCPEDIVPEVSEMVSHWIVKCHSLLKSLKQIEYVFYFLDS